MPISATDIVKRFRGFLPVVVDVETGGFNSETDALLEIAATILRLDESGTLFPAETYSCHVEPFEGANIEQAALDVTGIRLDHPFRMAVDEKEALTKIFLPIRQELKLTRCTRAVLVGHNPSFDLGFVKAAVARTQMKRNPFHAFSTFDTATLAGLAYGQTVLARAVKAAEIEWEESQAHSAIYDTERTADLFCKIINRWSTLSKLEQNLATKE
ncbi:MAG: ribonuclease T [Proteobacteria bacterium]|nr:ribonuclease T [Pseudomonadota bacterium]